MSKYVVKARNNKKTESLKIKKSCANCKNMRYYFAPYKDDDCIKEIYCEMNDGCFLDIDKEKNCEHFIAKGQK